MSFGQAVFSVITHFNFEVADAILGNERLQQSVEGVSMAAQQAQSSLTGVGLSFLTGLGYLPASIMGAVGFAVKASESFEQSALSWANLISANKEHLTGPIENFQERLKMSETIMNGIYRTSLKFGLNGKELETYTKIYASEFIPKGVGGDNLEFATTFARNLLKSAPNLGYDAANAQSQIQRSIDGGASRSDPFFRRLTMETPGMKEFQGPGGAQRFNTMDATKRIYALNTALSFFAKDTDITTARANTLTNQLQNLQTIMTSSISILRPVGDVIRNVLVEGLVLVNGYLDGPIRGSFEDLAGVLKIFAPNLETLFLNFRHLQRMQNVLGETKSTIHWVGMFDMVIGGMAMLKLAFPALGGKMMMLAGVGLGHLGTAFVWVLKTIAPIITYFGGWMPMLGRLFIWFGRSVLLPTAALMFVIDIFKRAQGFAELTDIKKLPGLLATFTGYTKRIINAFDAMWSPISGVMDIWAKSLSGLFAETTWIEMALEPMRWIADAMEGLAYGSMIAFAAIEALGAVLGHFSAFYFDGEWDKINGAEMGRIWNEVFDEANMRMLNKFDEGKLSVNSHTTVGKVEITNKFKENMEPDRIAFTIRDQLVKLGSNPVSGRGVPMYPVGGR